MNWKFSAVQTAYLTGLGVWVAGDLLLGALVLPAVFGALPDRAQAGALASTLLARFAMVKWACLVLVAAAVAVRYAAWEQPSPFILTRFAALGLLTATFLFSYFVLSPRLELLRPEVAVAALDAPVRAEFARLHQLAVVNGLAGTAAGLIALFLS